MNELIKLPKNKIYSTVPIAIQIKLAFAKLDFTLSELLEKAHMQYIIKFKSGIYVINFIKTQSPSVRSCLFSFIVVSS